MVIYLFQKLSLTFFKLSDGWQMLGMSLALKRSRTILQHVVLLSKQVKIKMTCGWGIRYTFQRTGRFRLWHDSGRIFQFRCRNIRLFGHKEIGTGEALTLLDGLLNLKDLSNKERNSLFCLSNLKDKLEKIRVLNKKESHVNDISF